MTRLKSDQLEKDAIRTAAALMAASARTAPKGKGIDAIDTLVLDGEDLEELAKALERKADDKKPPYSAAFKRDAAAIRRSWAVLLVGARGSPKNTAYPLDCGACGYDGCVTFDRIKKRTRDYTGPVCIFQALDLGIAIASAVRTARDLNVDNRILYTAGAAAKALGLLPSDIIIGIPLSITGKSPFFDRAPV